tara:strand:+ start:3781 stop:4476 length:696 start_codon:yes stop_codon:yes gene_type:complete
MSKIFFFIKKIVIKLLSHFSNPIQAIKFDIRKISFLLKKYKLIYIYKIDFKIDNNLFEPDYCDLDNLINLILKHKPKLFLELGGGYSTIAIIYALNVLEKKSNHKYKLITYDQSETYLKKTIDLIPQELCKNVEFVYSPLEVKNYNNVLMSFYKDLKVLNYDFIYEDRHDHEQTKIAGDIIKLEELLENDFSFCVDGMLASVEYYKNNLKKKYSISNSFFHGTNFIRENIS